MPVLAPASLGMVGFVASSIVLTNRISMKTPLDHGSLTLVLERLGVERGASEVHGLLCGLLCTGKSDKAKVKWFTDLLEGLKNEPGKVEALADEIRQLDALFSHTLEQLNGAMFEFQLLLPFEAQLGSSAVESDADGADATDHGSVEERTRALAQWCSGYAYGFGTGDQARKDAALPADTRELLQDIQEIARAETSIAAPSESDEEGDVNWEQTEQDLAELEEYVRVGVVVINEELQPVLGKPSTKALH